MNNVYVVTRHENPEYDGEIGYNSSVVGVTTSLEKVVELLKNDSVDQDIEEYFDFTVDEVVKNLEQFNGECYFELEHDFFEMCYSVVEEEVV